MKRSNLENLETRYLQLFPKRGVESEVLHSIERELGIILPEDFKYIATFFDGYEEIACQSFFSFNPSIKGWNIVEKTKFYRKSDCSLPTRYLALREEAESFVVMETPLSPANFSPVMCLSLSDAYNLGNSRKLEDDPIIFSSFSAFFEHLLDEEEKERNLDSN